MTRLPCPASYSTPKVTAPGAGGALLLLVLCGAAYTFPDSDGPAAGKKAEVRLAFADAFRMLSNRINIFVSLPMRSLDRLSLQRQLDAIGETKDAGQDPASAA